MWTDTEQNQQGQYGFQPKARGAEINTISPQKSDN